MYITNLLHQVPKSESASPRSRDNIQCCTYSLYAQVLTQEDWNIVLFSGMQYTSHWAALYFVALMTFGNYVLFNLLVAILVEGFSNQVSEASIELFRSETLETK